MAEFKPTAEQNTAITARGDALLISAGAGSGKTRVLTERLMSYLKDETSPLEISDFLVITYTRAAAGELRGRIISAISGELRDNPANRRLRRQSALAHRAEIDTIHSFCGRIVRESAHRLELPPDFRIAEEDECDAIKSSVIDTLLDERYENIYHFEGFDALVDTLSPGRDDSLLITSAFELYDNLRSHPDSDAWASAQLQMLSPHGISDASETPWGAMLLEKARETAEFWCARLRSALDEHSDSPEIIKSLGECFAAAIIQAERFLTECENGWDAAMRACDFSFPRAKPLRGEGFEGIKALWSSCRDGLRSLSDIFTASSSELLTDMDAVYPMTAALFSLVSDFGRAYSAEKQRRRLVDFSDLEHYALRLFISPDGSPTDVAQSVSERYAEIMIDEYQDVSRLQELIFGAISRGGKNLVMVGDVRQSIYRFRLAEPSIFLSKYRAFSDDGGESSPGRRIILSDNFRSRAEVLGAVNEVFSRIMSERFGEMDYTEREYLYPGRTDLNGGEPVELNILDCEKPEDDSVAFNRHVLEAQFVARRIAELVASGFQIPEGDSSRCARYSDIVILLRSRTHAAEYAAALSRLGIPVQTDSTEPLLDQYEVQIARSMLEITDNPHNDIPLLAVLRSQAFGFTPDELAAVRLCSPDSDFFTALTVYSEQNEKARGFISALRQLRALAPELGAEGMLWHIYGSMQLPALFGALSGGERRRQNLIAFAEAARHAASYGRHSIFEFLRHLPYMNELAAVSAAATDGVRIMTIHKSKGLEFPIVFLPEMSRRFNMRDARRRTVFHSELGAGLMRVDLARRIEYPTLPRMAIAEKIAQEAKAEELRVLYVAMTRAREKLIVTYSETDAHKTLDKLRAEVTNPLPPQLLAKQSGIGNVFLLAVLSLPENSVNWDIRHIALCENDFAEPQIVHITTSQQPPLPPSEPMTYPYPVASLLPSKLTVTELKNRAIDAELLEDARQLSPDEHTAFIERNALNERGGAFRRPDFVVQRTAVTGAERGTALHNAMRHLPMREYAAESEICTELDILTARGLLSTIERDAIDERRLLRFFASDLGRRAVRADELLREFKFSLLVPAHEYFENGGDDEILFQGVVDLALREGDFLTVVDFKTDRLAGSDALDQKIAVYTPQVEAYMRALRRVTGLSVNEGWIYFFDGGIAAPVI